MEIMEITGPCGNGLDLKKVVAEQYINVHTRSYLDASDEVRKVIDEMARICADQNTDPDDRQSAMDTLLEALFPQIHRDGNIGVDVEMLKVIPADGSDVPTVHGAMADEEATFAARLSEAMDKKNIGQAELAKKIGVGQPAISMMLARNCRPQKRTITKLAEALGIDPKELWPSD